MDYFGGIDPLASIGANLITPGVSQVSDPKTVKEEFMAIFLAQLLKETLKNQGSFLVQNEWGGGYGQGIFNDLFIQSITQELAESGSFGFQDLFPASAKTSVGLPAGVPIYPGGRRY